MRKVLMIAAMAAAAFAPALAQPAPKATAAKASAPVAAPQWRVDAANSTIGFASSADGTVFRGAFRRWTADIRFDPANLAGSSIRAVIDPASVFSGLEARDKTLQEADWFDSARNRQVVFQSTNIRAVSAGRYEAVGTLTVKGRATPVTLPFALAITGANADAQGALTLDRTRLGLGAAIPTDMVPAAVSATVRVKATRV